MVAGTSLGLLLDAHVFSIIGSRKEGLSLNPSHCTQNFTDLSVILIRNLSKYLLPSRESKLG